MTQLLSDVSRGVRIVHEWHFGGERYRALTERDCPDAVFVERWRPGLYRWERDGCLVDSEAALVLELARAAGRMS